MKRHISDKRNPFPEGMFEENPILYEQKEKRSIAHSDRFCGAVKTTEGTDIFADMQNYNNSI